MRSTQKFICTICFAAMVLNASAQSDNNYKGFRRYHFTIQAGFNATSIDEVMTQTFANEMYQGTSSLLENYLTIGGSPQNNSGINPVLNTSFDFSLNHRFKLGIAVNGIPETHITGFINKDSIYNNPDYTNEVYDKVDEIVRGVTFKTQAIYALKPYHGGVGLGWELDLGAGLTCNFVNIKQQFLLQSVDSLTQQIISDSYHIEKKGSSIGAYFLGRLDVHLSRGFSIVGDFNWMFDTGVKVDETHFHFYDTTREISSHHLKFNSYLIAVGVAFHL